MIQDFKLFTKNMSKIDYAVEIINSPQMDTNPYTVIKIKQKNTYNCVKIFPFYGCCGAMCLSLLEFKQENGGKDECVTFLINILKELYDQKNMSVSYVTSQTQDNVCNILKEIGFSEVFKFRNRKTNNLCKTWMIDLTDFNFDKFMKKEELKPSKLAEAC